MKRVINLSLSLCLISALSSCMLEGNDPDSEIIIEPCPAEFKATWIEIEKKMGDSEWESIENNDTLVISGNYMGSSIKDIAGSYSYHDANDLNLTTSLDENGGIIITEESITFKIPTKQDSVSLPIYYTHDNGNSDSLLVIYNDQQQPSIEVKFQQKSDPITPQQRLLASLRCQQAQQ